MMEISLAMDDTDRAACLALRRMVFIEEQEVPEDLEVDGLDDQCLHILARENGTPVGTARVRLSDDSAKIQRVCVPAEYRGRGIGSAVMTFAIGLLKKTPKISSLRLGSQTHALEFYHKLGFRKFGDEYLDAGIPHYDMELLLKQGAS